MPITMAPPDKKNTTGKRGRPQTGRKPTYNIHTNIDADLGAAFEKYLGSQKYEPKLKDVIETAIRLLLESEGHPLPGKKDESDD